MDDSRDHAPRTGTAVRWKKTRSVVLVGGALLCLVGAGASTSLQHPRQQQPASAAPALVFDSVTVVDVEGGRLIPTQRVVVEGNRIRAVGPVHKVKLPKEAKIIDAHGKYLIPGLWDMHAHPSHFWDPLKTYLYPQLLANGITGIRNAASPVPLDTLRQWRREILAGVRVGPPRQILSGKSLDSKQAPDSVDCPNSNAPYHACIADLTDVRRIVDSSKAAGVEMLKTYELTPKVYFAVAAEARRIGLPFGGHAELVTALEASDSGARIIDHVRFTTEWPTPKGHQIFDACFSRQSASVEQCRPLAERFRRNGTWLLTDDFQKSFSFKEPNIVFDAYWNQGSLPTGNWLHDVAKRASDSVGFMRVVQQLDWPMLAGTDINWIDRAGFMLHLVLAGYVLEGLTPLEALRSATLNPAKALHGTDSLGTVAPGKLADLVLLDADPLEDITNTTTIRAVVANGRYYDRATLDSMLLTARAEAKAAEAKAAEAEAKERARATAESGTP